MLSTAIQYKLATERAEAVATRSEIDLSKFDSEIRYFRANIKNVKSNAGLLADQRLFNFAMAAFDLPVDNRARGFMRTLLSEDINSSASKVNQLDNTAYKEFARIFQFTETTNAAITSSDVSEAVIERFRNLKISEARLNAIGSGDALVDTKNAATPIDNADPYLDLAEADREIEYFQDNAFSIETADELLANRRLINFALEAYQLPSTNLSDSFVEAIFTEDPEDANSQVNQPGNERYKDVVNSFVFGSGNGDEGLQSLIDAQKRGRIRELTDQYTFITRLEARFSVAASSPATANPVALQSAPALAPIEGAPAVTSDRQEEIDYFLANIGNVQSADDLINDFRLFEFVMTAFDLQSQLDAKGLMRAIMTEDRQDDDSAINRLQSSQYREFGAIFDFTRITRRESEIDRAANTLTVTKTEEIGGGFANVRDKRELLNIVDRYISVSREIDEGEENPGVRLALYFDRNAGDVASYFGILADGPLREFIFQAFSLPSELNQLPSQNLAARLEELFDLDELKSADGRKSLIDRFNALYELDNPSSVSTPILSLVQPLGAGAGASLANTASLIR